MRVRGAAQVIGVILLAAASSACGGDAERSAAPSTSSPSTPSPSASPMQQSPTAEPAELPSPVRVGKLPSEGVAISIGNHTALVRLDGGVVSDLRGFHLAGNPGAKGVWLQRGRNYFRLDAGKGELTPVARNIARTKIYEEGPEPDLPPPADARVNGRIAGRWRYAYEDGARTLAQWSGECEVPTVFWVEGSSMTIVTGGTELSGAPESLGLGWSSSGDAVVLLGEGACGTAGDPPGVYAFSAPGDGELIFEAKGFASADMWS